MKTIWLAECLNTVLKNYQSFTQKTLQVYHHIRHSLPFSISFCAFEMVPKTIQKETNWKFSFYFKNSIQGIFNWNAWFVFFILDFENVTELLNVLIWYFYVLCFKYDFLVLSFISKLKEKNELISVFC